MKITDARRTKLVVRTGFGGYTVCLNPYVGCQFGCKYCYVRFFIKDKDENWGNFVRRRNYIQDKLPKERKALEGQKLVLGTMTDPYQPIELKARLTRKTLEIIKDMGNPCDEIGIFTRSPLVRNDINLIKELGARVHLTITPFPREHMKKIEPVPIKTEARFKTLDDLVKAEVKCYVSISPILPVLSDSFIGEFCDRIAEIKPEGFTVDPMQCYGPSFEATNAALGDDPLWLECREIIQSQERYQEWKKSNMEAWRKAWSDHFGLGLQVIIMDHQSRVRYDLVSGGQIDFYTFKYM